MKTTITPVAWRGLLYWKAREIGRLLGYGAGGGNLSRMFVSGMGGFKSVFAEGRDWILESLDGPRSAIWLSPRGLVRLLSWEAFHVPKHAQAARELYDSLYERGFGPTLPFPGAKAETAECEDALGPGFAVRYTDEGVVSFVVLDEDDRATIVHTRDLDPGWRRKLIGLLSSSPRVR